MASRVGRCGATRRTTCTASSRSGTSTWIWAPQMCCSLTSTWYSCCMCANRAPRRDVAPVDVDQRHRARRHHTEAVRFGGLGQPGPQPLQVRPQLVEGVAHRRVRLHQRSLQLGCELRTVELAQERVDLGGGPPRLEVHDVELFLGPDLELPAAHGRDGRERVLRGRCPGVTGRGGECTREAARLPLTSHLRVGMRPVVRGEWHLGALRRHRLGSEGCATAMIGKRSTRATSVSGSVDQALITGTDRGRAGRRGRRRILADLALCALRGAAFPRAAGLTSCGCC